MTEDRRLYSRLDINIDACMFCEGLNMEIKSKILDIGEKGIGLEVDVFEDYEKYFYKGAKVKVQLMDSYSFGSGMETVVLNIECFVRYVKREDEKLTVGCFVNRDDYERYVRHREVSNFLSVRNK